MDRSPVDVLAVVGALGAVFAIATTFLVAREERRARGDAVPEVRPAKVVRERPVTEPRVRPAKVVRERPVKEPRVRPATGPVGAAGEAAARIAVAPVSIPDPRRVAAAESGAVSEPEREPDSLVLNLQAFTEFRSR